MSQWCKVGYSQKIRDPAFKKYLRHSAYWSFIFAGMLAVASIAGFALYGAYSAEMDNPEAVLIGLGIGCMFLMIAALQTVGRGMSRTWDGVVADKYIKSEQKKIKYSDSRYKQYLEFTVVIKSQSGKCVNLTVEDDDTLYNYYQIGDRVRHHKGLNSFEKYDKTNDDIIFCGACASLNNIEDDRCFRCGCPLLK
jgi:uncharacterized CHY-type Zn-finger protein